MDIKMTVAMPVWNSRRIAWLPMEGLCRQVHPGVEWELLVCEEVHGEACGREFFEGYSARLGGRGCARVSYLSPSEWVPPGMKWHMMGVSASPSSEVFLIQDADCFSFPERLSKSLGAIGGGAHWYDVQRGYFYHIPSGRLLLYDEPNPGSTHLNMAFTSASARSVPPNDKTRLLNGWLKAVCREFHGGEEKFRKVVDKRLYAGLDTHGFNNISSKRGRYFKKPSKPFKATSKTLRDLGLPGDVVKRLEGMR